MIENTNKAEKIGPNFDLTTDSIIEKNKTIKFKIHISKLTVKIELKQRSLNQIRHCWI